MSLEKILRLSGSQEAGSSGDELRELAKAVHLALSEAVSSDDPAHAAELIYAAASAAEGLSAMLFSDGLQDWVEATAAAPDSTIALGGNAPGNGSKPYGNVTYADPGYQKDGKKRYPVDTEDHARAAWAYINKAKNAAAYSAGQLAKIKGSIKSAMKKFGIGSNVTASSVMSQLRDGEAWVVLAAAPASQQGIPMSHAPFSGTHTHAHAVTMTHEHEHTHVNDSSHGSQMHGNNAAQKSWAAKGMSHRGMHGDY